MKLTRTQAREKVMIILYQIDIYSYDSIDYDVKEVIKENIDIDSKYVDDVVNGVLDKLDEIDGLINKYLKQGWSIDRLGKTDRAILRLSTYEMVYYDTPSIVVINEAIELSKKYSDEKVIKLINAVLDNIRDSEGKNE